MDKTKLIQLTVWAIETSPFVVFVDYRKVTVAEIDQVEELGKKEHDMGCKDTFVRKAVKEP